MEENEQPTYLIPANSKRSALIASMFRPLDLGILLTGVGLTLLLLFTISDSSLVAVLLKLAPGLICAFLVLPIPNYHNTLVLIRELYLYFTNRRIYLWKGWCIYDGTKDKQ